MATIRQIEQALDQAARTNNMSLMTSTINSITTAQRSQVNPVYYQRALDAIANHTYTNDAVTESTARNFMSKVGSFVPAASIDAAILKLAQDSNLSALDAVTDYVTAAQKTQLNSSTLGSALNSLASHSIYGTDAAAATAIRDFMVKFTSRLTGSQVDYALLTVGRDGNFDAVDAITDNLNATQRGQINSGIIVEVLNAMAGMTFNLNDQVVANAVRDFVSKMGYRVGGAVFENALLTFANDGNLAGIDAITDNLNASQKSQISLQTLGHVLERISFMTFNANDQVVADAVRDFMAKMSPYMGGALVENSLVAFVNDGNLAGIDAITDNLSDTQKAQISSQVLGYVIERISFLTYSTLSDQVVADAVRDFMVKMGSRIGGALVESSLVAFVSDGNLAGIDAITDNLNTSQKSQISAQTLGHVVERISFMTFAGNDQVVADAVRDFMVKMGPYMGGALVESSLVAFVNDGNLAGIDAITDNLSASQKSQISLQTLGHVLERISFMTFNANDQVVADAVRDFMAKMSPYMGGALVENSLIAFSNDANWQGLDAIFDNLSQSQISQLSPAVLSNLANRGVLFFTDANDVWWGAQRDEVLFMRGGDDIVVDNESNDVIFAGAGNDTITTRGAGNDTYYGEEGIDTLYYVDATGPVWVNLGTTLAQNTISTGTDVLIGFENIFGSNFNDSFIGSHGDNVIRGGNGWDVIDGMGGVDALFGDAGVDSLNGGDGNDYLYGGDDMDWLWGGLGADRFMFTARDGSVDQIRDFSRIQGDVLDISSLLAGSGATQAAINEFVSFRAISNMDGTSTTFMFVDRDGAATGSTMQMVAELSNAGYLDAVALAANGQLIF